MVRMQRAIGGVSQEHSKHGSLTLILSPTFNVILPYLQVFTDFAPSPASMTSSSRAVPKIKTKKNMIKKQKRKRKTQILKRVKMVRTAFEFEWTAKTIIEIDGNTAQL